MSFTDGFESYFDLWILGDKSLKTAFNDLQIVINECQENKQLPRPYIQDYYNILSYTTESSNDVPVISRVANALQDAIKERHCFQRFLLVFLDKDVIANYNVFDKHVVAVIQEAVEWLVRQISIEIRHHRLQLIDKKPGAVYGSDPTVIFIRMMRRADLKFKRGSARDEIFSLRAKFNDALNNAVSRYNFRIMTINSCNTNAHFDRKGNLSIKGREALWQEIDYLLEMFDKNKVKLLPNPINNRSRSSSKQHQSDK